MSIGTGEAIYIALKPILKIYSIIFVGFLLVRYNILTMEVTRGVSSMVVNAILPCLTFNKIVGNISWEDIKEVGVIVLSALILFALGGTLAALINYLTPVPKRWFWGALFAGVFPNISDLPIAYVQSMGNGALFNEEQADKGVAYSCIFLFTQSMLMMNFGLWRVIGFDFTGDINDEDVIDNYPMTDLSSKREEEEAQRDLEKNTSSAAENSASRPTLPSTHSLMKDAVVSTTASTMIYSNDTANDDFGSIDSNAISLDENDAVDFEYIQPYELPDYSTSRIKRSASTNSSPGILETSSLHRIRTLGHDTSRFKRRRPTLNDVIAEYSAVEKIKTGELNLNRPLSLMDDIGEHNNNTMTETSDSESELSSQKKRSMRFKISQFSERHHLQWLTYFLINFFRPASLGAILGIICALIPWVKACFVDTYVHVHKAPDGEPVLNFLMDFTEYIGNACVPLGLLMLGGTLARLQIKELPKGFIRSAILLTIFRLVLIPIIGILWANKLYNLNWLDNVVSKFVMILTWSMPSATAQIYFTAFYTPVQGSHLQMDCLSVFFMLQYVFLFITLSFIITYTLKVDLNL
ncbi:hypothetical protein KAFR_0B05970 [Kazachstania africana CBS 2517]|uniref:Auxin efflux carrier component n=1 Tax=Kazachstania africana (strain ATCC 22294 / BCRC 22015 / CBS 2517 / CECT 1963 / NBRC 1671 / NRRL Y-8276) TaxID=1071382 RepID=H2AR93_KAZAF|nr:hypothetical protein KAFR_0B05970 [Kazachstania africana CBS 2517]CCF56893.1 hypothetical protein KAFR_0B05970 [Kazachstania africana CBS 2517]